MSAEWTTETDREFQEYFPIPDDLLQMLKPQPKRLRPWKLLGAVILVGSIGLVAWCMSSVFLWGGNLLPRW